MSDGATPDEPTRAVLAGEPRERVLKYARLILNYALCAGAFLVIGFHFIAGRVHGDGSPLDLLIGIAFTVMGLGQGLNTFVRYRQLRRYLDTGSGSRYEDLVREAQQGHDPPPDDPS